VIDLHWDREPDLGELHRFYKLLSQDPAGAVTGLESLANRGSVASMWYLAELYAGRKAMPKCIDKAKYWYTRAKEKGYVEASHMLGRIAYDEHDCVRAFSEFSAGANTGYPPSMYRLGLMYGKGEGVGIDSAKQIGWLSEAAGKGHLFAKRNLAALYLSGRFGLHRFIRGLSMLFSFPVDLIRLKATKNNDEFYRRTVC
jgi:TPR repeat protein